jgi:hypothetical protein
MSDLFTASATPDAEPPTASRSRSRGAQIKPWQVTNKALVTQFEKKDYQSECHITDATDWEELELCVIPEIPLF